VTVLRGNAGEVATLVGAHAEVRGVESIVAGLEPAELARTAAARLGVIASVTGPVDHVSDGERVLTVANGHELLATVTGTGCMSSALTGCFLAAKPDAPVEAAAEALQAELEQRERAVRRGLFEPQLRVDVVASERPREHLRGPHHPHEQHAARRRPAEERRAIGRMYLPARAFGDAAPVGPHGGDPGPPVGEVVRLGDKRPDVVARREQLTRGADARHGSADSEQVAQAKREVLDQVAQRW
jgi:hypothetical protein